MESHDLDAPRHAPNGFAFEEAGTSVVGRCWHPGFGRSAKPDFSLARPSLRLQGCPGSPRGGGGACCHSWVAALWFPELEPQSDGAGGRGSTRTGTGHSSCRERCAGSRAPPGFSHLGRRGCCTRAAFHSKGMAFSRRPRYSPPRSGRREGTRPALSTCPRGWDLSPGH